MADAEQPIELEKYAMSRKQSPLAGLILCALDAAIEGGVILGVLALAAYFVGEALTVGKATLIAGWIVLTSMNVLLWRASLATNRFCAQIEAIGSYWRRSAP